MITINTLFAQINFDQNKEYVIYHKDYPADKYGRPLPEGSEVNSWKYGYGNMIIETERKRYTISAVYNAHEWTAHLVDYIASHKDDDHIFVDMNVIWTWGDACHADFECGDILVETL